MSFGTSQFTHLLQELCQNDTVAGLTVLYEQFLKALDPARRRRNGIYFTPQPIASFIVRSVNEVLREEFHLEDGLADNSPWRCLARRSGCHAVLDSPHMDRSFVRILDPAAGTGIFLVEVIRQIHRQLLGRWRTEGCASVSYVRAMESVCPAVLIGAAART